MSIWLVVLTWAAFGLTWLGVFLALGNHYRVENRLDAMEDKIVRVRNRLMTDDRQDDRELKKRVREYVEELGMMQEAQGGAMEGELMQALLMSQLGGLGNSAPQSESDNESEAKHPFILGSGGDGS